MVDTERRRLKIKIKIKIAAPSLTLLGASPKLRHPQTSGARKSRSDVLDELGLVDSDDLENGVPRSIWVIPTLIENGLCLVSVMAMLLQENRLGPSRESKSKGVALGFVSGGGGEERESGLKESGERREGGDGEIGVENLVEESGDARWVAEGERGGRGFDEVRVEVLGLVRERREREEEGIFYVGVGVAGSVGDCRHHHRHHRSVYKKNFFSHHLFLWG